MDYISTFKHGFDDHILLETMTALLCFCLIYGVCLITYRLRFHPLASFPGLKFAAATKWYEFYFDIIHGQGGSFMFEIDRMHDVYGPIIRINPDELHIKDPSFYGSLYGAVGSIRDKYPPAANMAGTGLGTFGTVWHHVHRQRRSAIAALYSKQTVNSYQHIIRSHVEILCKVLREECTDHGTTELRTKYLAFSTDVISEYSFGKPWGLLLDNRRAVEWKETIAALAYFTPHAKQLGWLLPIAKHLHPQFIAYFSPGLSRLIGMFRETRSRALQDVLKHTALPSGKNTLKSETDSDDGRSRPPTIFEEILTSKLSLEEKSVKRMSEEGVIIISAGSETIGRTLTCCTFHLLDNPNALHALKTELLSVMPHPENIPSLKDLEQLPFLTAVIKESLRLACITASRLPIISPNTSLQYNDWLIPAGIPVAMTPHKTMMDPLIFELPQNFQPQRWLGSTTDMRRLDHCYVPFGRGHRMCLGINLAYAELYIVIATLFRRFDFELVDVVRERDIDPTRDCFVGEPSLESPGVKVAVRQTEVLQ